MAFGDKSSLSYNIPKTARILASAAMSVMMIISCSGLALSQSTQTPETHDIVAPPTCKNNKGEVVEFVDGFKGPKGLAAGMANRDTNGKPIVYRANYSASPPEFQLFIDRHECAHHQTGDIDRPHPARNSPAHLMNEAIADCIAILRMRDELEYDRAKLNTVTAAMRADMSKIGFPEISISSRISNIENCYTKFGSSQDFISGVLENRGLQQQ